MRLSEQVYKSISPVIDTLQHVQIDEDKIAKAISLINKIQESKWDNPYVFKEGTTKSVNYLALFAALSFRYWTDTGYWQKYVGAQELYGSYSLMYLMKSAIEGGIDITKAEVMRDLSLTEFSSLLIGHNQIEIPYLKERYEIMTEIGTVLASKYSGEFVKLFEAGNYDVTLINNLLVSDFQCFQDETIHRGSKIRFYKKSQEVITLVYEQFEGSGLGAFHNMEDLTVSSDYKLPQMLNALGILRYRGKLENRIKNEEKISDESRESIELRSATIEIGRLLYKEMQKHNSSLLPCQISNRLWTLSQDSQLPVLPHPRIDSIWV